MTTVERVVIELPNGDRYPAAVSRAGGWTRIEPDEGIRVEPSGLGEDLGDEHDYIYDLEIRGHLTTVEIVRKVVNAWLRDAGWRP